MPDVENIGSNGVSLPVADAQARADIAELNASLVNNHTWHLIKDNITNTDTAITIPSGYTELMMVCKHSVGYVFSKILPIDCFSSSGTTLMPDGFYLSSTNYMLTVLSITNKSVAKRFHQSQGSGTGGSWENPSLWGR